MGWWADLDVLNRLVFWLTIATVVSPFLFGLATLVIQSRAKTLEDQRVEALRSANQDLQRDLGESKRELSELQKRTAPWRLSDHQRSTIAQALQGVPRSRVFIACRLMDGESCDFADDLGGLLRGSGWDVTGPNRTSLNSFRGVAVFSNSDQVLPGQPPLFSALQRAGVTVEARTVEANSLGGAYPDNAVFIVVGRRPT